VLLSIGLLVTGVALSLVALTLTRRARRSHHFYYHKAPIAGDILGVIGTGFTVLLAFVILIAFESYERARDESGVESVATRQMESLTAFFPQQSRIRLQDDLVCYARAVVNDEWRTMAVGQSSPVVDHWVDQLDDDMVALPVTTNKEIEVFNTWFSRAAERQEGRRGRLAESAPYVPPFVWAMLVLLFVVVVGYQVLFASPKRPLIPQVLGVSAVAATMLAGIVVVYVLDAPFADRGAQLPPTRMQSTLTAMETEYQGNPTPIPCDATGNPTR